MTLQKKLNQVKERFGFILVLMFLCIAVPNSVQKIAITGISMEPALLDGDVAIANKLSYHIIKPKRYDMVVFRYLYERDQYYVKRIIGLPGETVQIKEGSVFINGKRLLENYGSEPIEKARRAAEPIILGEDEYFVLGDNRNHSSDSRDSDVANVSRNQITGKVWFRIWPLIR